MVSERIKHLLAVLTLTGCLVGCVESLPCNGHPDLCDRTLQEVALPATHNSMSSAEDEFWEPNQEYGIARQLADGIRGFLLDIYPYEGDVFLCHGFCDLGKTRLRDVLKMVREWLDSHPREVLVFIFENHVKSPELEAIFKDVGLDGYVYTHVAGAALPTLGEMIAKNQRVLVGMQQGGAPPEWIHHAWDVFFDTPYSFKAVEEFSCDLYRGDATHPLFLLNHWLSGDFGLPNSEDAASTNSYETLYTRAKACWDVHGQLPNLVAVDFYATGDLIKVVAELNGL